MSVRPLALPQATSCPVCGRLMEQVQVALVFTEETGELEAVAVACPHCRTKYDFSIETMAQAVALEAVTRLQAGQ